MTGSVSAVTTLPKGLATFWLIVVVMLRPHRDGDGGVGSADRGDVGAHAGPGGEGGEAVGRCAGRQGQGDGAEVDPVASVVADLNLDGRRAGAGAHGSGCLKCHACAVERAEGGSGSGGSGGRKQVNFADVHGVSFRSRSLK